MLGLESFAEEFCGEALVDGDESRDYLCTRMGIIPAIKVKINPIKKGNVMPMKKLNSLNVF